MSAALFDFCLILLLVVFFLYGLREWDHLLAAPEDENDRVGGKPQEDIPGRRVAVWVLLIGLTLVSVITGLFGWYQGE